jgi:hypothetical protein
MTTPVALRRSDPAVKRLLAATFPDYRGRKLSAVRWDDRPLHLDLSWSGGTVDKVVLVDVASGRIGTLVVPSPWSRGAADPVDVPAGAILAVHSYFVGVDAGVTFYVRPLALDAPVIAGLLG